jgi:outer membrane protein assembly factor BamA
MSNFLSKKVGFMPVPIIITEPAVGYGAGLAAMFLHDPLAGRTEEGEVFDPLKPGQSGRVIPPSVSALAVGGTQNGTWFAGGMHYGIWKQDRIRYLGALGTANINMKFYGLGGGLAPTDNKGLEFNTRANFMIQQVQFRIKDSNFFVGARYNILGTNNTFDTSSLLPIPGVPNLEFSSRSAAIGAMINYDGRDNIFTPNKGLTAQLSASNYSEKWGGEADFNKYRLYAKYWHPLGEKFVLGLRGDGEKLANGPAPFYEYPFVDLRGIPVMRYQGEEVLTGETELRWDVGSRWSLVGFLGAGHTSGGIRDTVEETVYSKGIGFRYLAARRYGLRVGIDIARGPEDTAFYIQVGNAWGR